MRRTTRDANDDDDDDDDGGATASRDANGAVVVVRARPNGRRRASGGSNAMEITARLVRELERARRRASGEDVGENERDARAASGGERGGASTSGIGAKPGTAARGLFAPADLLSTARVAPGNHREAIADEAVRRRHPDVDGALRASERVGDLLLKREEGEIARTRRFVEELDALERDPFNGAREPPCAVEAASVRACYGANAANVTACHDLVDEYKKCGRVALRKFVSREPAAA